MATPILTAVDFRTHLPRILEKVAYTNQRFVVQRYGHQMVAIVSFEDLEYLEKHRPLPEKPKSPEPEFQRPHAAAEALGLMSTDVEGAVKRLYEERKRKREIKRRVLELERREAEAERQEEEKRQRREHWLNHGPRIMPEDELVSMYRELYDDRTDQRIWLWRDEAWCVLKLNRLTEGLQPPPPLEQCPGFMPGN